MSDQGIVPAKDVDTSTNENNNNESTWADIAKDIIFGAAGTIGGELAVKAGMKAAEGAKTINKASRATDAAVKAGIDAATLGVGGAGVKAGLKAGKAAIKAVEKNSKPEGKKDEGNEKNGIIKGAAEGLKGGLEAGAAGGGAVLEGAKQAFENREAAVEAAKEAAILSLSLATGGVGGLAVKAGLKAAEVAGDKEVQKTAEEVGKGIINGALFPLDGVFMKDIPVTPAAKLGVKALRGAVQETIETPSDIMNHFQKNPVRATMGTLLSPSVMVIDAKLQKIKKMLGSKK